MSANTNLLTADTICPTHAGALAFQAWSTPHATTAGPSSVYDGSQASPSTVPTLLPPGPCNTVVTRCAWAGSAGQASSTQVGGGCDHCCEARHCVSAAPCSSYPPSQANLRVTPVVPPTPSTRPLAGGCRLGQACATHITVPDHWPLARHCTHGCCVLVSGTYPASHVTLATSPVKPAVTFQTPCATAGSALHRAGRQAGASSVHAPSTHAIWAAPARS